VTGDITASNAYLRGNLVVSGNIILGNIVSGQTTSSDSITVVADFTSDLVPNESSSYDLGAAGRTWANVYTDNLSLTSVSGLDAPNNIVYVNNLNQLTASNDFEYIPGDRVRIGSGSFSSSFYVEAYTGNTFISGGLSVTGSTGISAKGNLSSSQGFVTAVSAAFDNLRAPGGSNDSIVIASNGYLTNTSDLRFVGDGLDIGNNKFTVNKTNGNTFTSGTLHALGQFSGSSAILRQTLQVDGGTTLNNQLSVLGPTANVNINQNLRVDGSGSFGNGLDVAGNVVLNVGGAGTVFISGSSRLGDDAQNDSVVISGSFNQIFTGTALQNLFVRNSAVKSSSITFDDDNSPLISGLAPNAGKIVIRNRSNDGTLDSYLITNVTSSGIAVTNPSAGGNVTIGYTNVTDNSSIRVNIGATNGIALNSRTQISSNLSVSGSTILGVGGDDLLIVASPTTMSGDIWNQGYIANLGSLKVSSSFEVTGSTILLGTVTMGDLRTQSGSGILGSASFDSDVRVGRDLYVNGTRTSFKPKLIEIASGSSAAFEAEGAGLFISGTNAQFVYREIGDRMYLNKGLKIDGDSVSGFGLQVSASTYLSGNLEVSGNLDVYGNINLGNVTVTNTASIQELVVVNDISGGRDLRLKRNISITGSSNILLNQAITGALDVNGATRLASTLNVVGEVGLNNVLRVTGSTAISGGLFVSGNTELSSSLTVKEYSFFEKNLRVSGNLQVDGNVDILGDVVSVNVSNLQIEDKNVIISRGSLSSLQSDDAGITIEGPTTPLGDGPIKFTWDHANQRMNLNKNFNISGSFLIQGDDIIDTAVALAIALG
jgi:cytoskeletal protein CcmA (bactofilin family)